MYNSLAPYVFDGKARMVNCPECGKPLEKAANGESKYYCQNEHCIVIFVRRPNKPNRMRVAYTSFMRKS